MQYALLCYESRDDFAAREDPSRSAAYWDGWMAYGSALKQAGVFVSGFYVIDVSDLDAALAWAAKCPSSTAGTTEVRPLLPPRRGSD